MIKFSSGDAFSIGAFESLALVGSQCAVRNPMLLPSNMPGVSRAFQMLFVDRMCSSATVQLDVQLQYKEHPEYTFDVSIVKMSAVAHGAVTLTELEPFTTVGDPCKFVFGDDLKTFADEGVGYRNTWSLKRDIPSLQNVHLRAGERLALSIAYSNVAFHSVSVNGALKFR